MSVTIPINTDEIITWRSLVEVCFDAIIEVCCNIDSYKGVPTRLQDGQGRFTVLTKAINQTSSQSTRTATWTTTPTNLVSVVSSSTVSTEWVTFLTAAGIDVHSDKVVQAKEACLLIGLYMQFMAYHLKPVCSSRQVYNLAESQVPFSGTKYVSGTVAPAYTLPGINPSEYPVVTDADIENVVKKNVGDGEGVWSDYTLFTSYNDPVFSTCPLA